MIDPCKLILWVTTASQALAEHMRLWGKDQGLYYSQQSRKHEPCASVSLAPKYPLGTHSCSPYGCHAHSGPTSLLRNTVFRKSQPYKGLLENLSKPCPRGRCYFYYLDEKQICFFSWRKSLCLFFKAICYPNMSEIIAWNKDV